MVTTTTSPLDTSGTRVDTADVDGDGRLELVIGLEAEDVGGTSTSPPIGGLPVIPGRP